ncbi:hypothetical protein HDE_10785 [Halotydeus destructor]|nr:hypothetical protein HDE_10785 [Halotydeus destructor]
MFKFAVYLTLVTWCVGLTEGNLLADIFDLVGTFLSLLGHQGGRSGGSSSGRATMSPEERDMRDCEKTKKPSGTLIIGCGICDSVTTNATVIAANEHRCGQQCRIYKCDLYRDNDMAGCLAGVRDNCQCAYVGASMSTAFITDNANKRKELRNTPAGNCTN